MSQCGQQDTEQNDAQEAKISAPNWLKMDIAAANVGMATLSGCQSQKSRRVGLCRNGGIL
jgi:hypothetical protein